MSGEQSTDRRGKYSFRGHVKRAVEKQGIRRLAVALGSTAVVASLAFAYCSSSSITSPDRAGAGGTRTIGIANGAVANANGTSSDGSSGGGTTVTQFPIVPDDEIPATLGETEVPTEMQATACNGDIVVWDDSRTRAGGVSYASAKRGSLRVVIKIKTIAKGHGTRQTGDATHPPDPTFPQRYYNGYEEYERETYFAPGVTDQDQEYDLHMIARDERETHMFQDDYMLRLKVHMRIDGTNLTITPKTMEKCF